MPTVNLGRVGIVNKGNYVGSTTLYKVNDIVKYNSSIYICTQQHNVEHLPTDNSYWTVWINTPDFVHSTGDETIAGVKTFSSQPVGIVKGSVGLGNVDNTSDANKPISAATQNALDLKISKDSATGVAMLTSGTTAQRPVLANGVVGMRYNTTLASWEGGIGTAGATTWGAIGGGATAATSYAEFVATAGQTVFTTPYTIGFVDVFINGVMLSTSDFTATNGTSITLGLATTAGQLVIVRGYSTFSVANTYSTSQIDTALANKANTSAVLPLAGGTMTGAITALRETKVAMGANDIDLASGNVFTKTISGATTLTVSNWLASGNANSFILELTNGGSSVVTWFSGVKWAGGTAPTLTASGVDILGFYSHDGGTTVRGIVLAKDSK